jgi:hypothetical protein
MTRWFVLPRFGSCKPTPRWGGHKDRVSFNPFPLSNGHLDRVSFSSQLVSLVLVTIEFESRKKEEEKQSKCKSSNEHKYLSLSLVTIWLECSLDLGEDLISLYVSWMKYIALVWGVKAENLDAMNGGWLGVFIAPTTKRAVGGGCCRMAHRTVRCATGHCLVRQPRHPVVGFWPLELLTAGPPDSPVVHQTDTVQCPVRLLALLWLLRAL